jgi:hypothetical protein
MENLGFDYRESDQKKLPVYNMGIRQKTLLCIEGGRLGSRLAE